MKLLHVVASLDPAGGGPMEGVLQSSLAGMNGNETHFAAPRKPTAAAVASIHRACSARQASHSAAESPRHNAAAKPNVARLCASPAKSPSAV